MAEMASANNTPTGGSASCTRVVFPNHVTMPLLPSRKSPPSGIIANDKNAGTNDKNGASLNTKRSERSGMRSSLKNNLIPSASVCSNPNGPALFGPMRFCIPEITLRSNHTISMVATRPVTNTASTLRSTMMSGTHSKLPLSIGSIANILLMTSSQF